MTHENLIETAKAAPPMGILAAWAADLNLQDWVLAATLIYTVLLIAEKLYKFWKETRVNRND